MRHLTGQRPLERFGVGDHSPTHHHGGLFGGSAPQRAIALLVGIENEESVPNDWNIIRFLASLGQEPYLSLLREVFDQMAQRLGSVVPDLESHTASDSIGLSGRREPDDKRRQAEIDQKLPQASGGRKEYKDDEGKITKVVEWFGYKLHLLVDVKHEIVLAYDITDALNGDNERIEALIEQGRANLP